MGRLMVSEFISIDGVTEAPGGEPGFRHTGWVGRFPDAGQFGLKLDEILAHEVLLLGRKTYETFARAWPERDGPFAEKMNAMLKYVASTTMREARWNNSTVLEGDVPTAVLRLKEEVAGDILVAGSRTLVNTLKAHDLVDLYRLMVFPIVLGSGTRLFDNAVDAVQLQLIEVQRFEGSAAVLTFERVREVAR